MNAMILAVVLYGLTFLMSMFAMFGGMLTPGQMRRRRLDRGIPFLYHGGMWSDNIIVNPLVIWLIWPALQKVDRSILSHPWCYIFPWIATFALNHFWKKGQAPDSLACFGHLTNAGKVHFVYMALVLPIICLYYFAAPQASAESMIVTGLLLLHVIIGSYLLVDIRVGTWRTKLPNLYDPLIGVIDLSLCVLIFGRQMYIFGHYR